MFEMQKQGEAMTETTEIQTVKIENAMEVFLKPNGLDPVLGKIRKEIDAFKPDISSEESRKEIASFAHRIARSKTYIDNVGKGLVDELKEKPKLIDAERKRIRETLDLWKYEVRKPLTDWENAEESRVNLLKGNLDKISSLIIQSETELKPDQVRELISRLGQMVPDESWEEFEADGRSYHSKAKEALNRALERSLKRESEWLELESLRREKEKKAREDREREIAETAKREAEEKAKVEAEKADQLAKLRENELRVQAEKAEREKREAIERAEKEKIEAVEREKRRIEAEKALKEAEEIRRQSDLNHRRKTNQTILALMVENGIPEKVAVTVITLAAQNKLGNLKVVY